MYTFPRVAQRPSQPTAAQLPNVRFVCLSACLTTASAPYTSASVRALHHLVTSVSLPRLHSRYLVYLLSPVVQSTIPTVRVCPLYRACLPSYACKVLSFALKFPSTFICLTPSLHHFTTTNPHVTFLSLQSTTG